MQNPRTILLLSSLSLLLSACGTEDRRESWSGAFDTLPNGVVRVTNPAMGAWGEDGGWRLAPELTLGALEGEEWEVFGQISGLEVDDDGRIYVLDRQVSRLRVFSPAGELLHTAGREGEGPGEYQAANGLEWLSPDSLLVIDQRGGRYTVLSREGEFIASMPRRLGFYSWAFRGGLAQGRIYEQGSVREGEEWNPALLGTSLHELGFAPEDASRGDTIMLPLSDAPPFEAFSIRTDRGGMSMAVPFAPSSVYHLARTGDLWHGHGSEFRIFRSTLAGDTLMEILVDAEPVPVTPEEVDEWAAGSGPERFRELGGELDMDRIPEVKPFFDGLYLDPDGYLWIQVPTRPGQALLRVIDPEGRYLGAFELDGFELYPWLSPVVRNGRLYLVGHDEFEVQRVYVFRIEG